MPLSTSLGHRGFPFSASRISLNQALLSPIDTSTREFVSTHVFHRDAGETPQECWKPQRPFLYTPFRNKTKPCGFKEPLVAWDSSPSRVLGSLMNNYVKWLARLSKNIRITYIVTLPLKSLMWNVPLTCMWDLLSSPPEGRAPPNGCAPPQGCAPQAHMARASPAAALPSLPILSVRAHLPHGG